MVAGAVALAAFVAWERHVGRAAAGSRWSTSALFRSAGFTWGTTLSTMISFALFGLTFAMPQFFLDVKGLNSLASGDPDAAADRRAGGRPRHRAAPAEPAQVQGRRSRPGRRWPESRPVGAGGFAIMAVALAIGTATSAASGTGFVSAWFAVDRLRAWPGDADDAQCRAQRADAERSGSGSALMTAMRQVGATIGVAVLGTVLNSVYRSKLDPRPGCPPTSRRRPGAASARASRSRCGCARRRCWTLSTPPTPAASTSCSGSAPRSPSRPRCSQRCSCRGSPAGTVGQRPVRLVLAQGAAGDGRAPAVRSRSTTAGAE